MHQIDASTYQFAATWQHVPDCLLAGIRAQILSHLEAPFSNMVPHFIGQTTLQTNSSLHSDGVVHCANARPLSVLILGGKDPAMGDLIRLSSLNEVNLVFAQNPNKTDDLSDFWSDLVVFYFGDAFDCTVEGLVDACIRLRQTYEGLPLVLFTRHARKSDFSPVRKAIADVTLRIPLANFEVNQALSYVSALRSAQR